MLRLIRKLRKETSHNHLALLDQAAGGVTLIYNGEAVADKAGPVAAALAVADLQEHGQVLRRLRLACAQT